MTLATALPPRGLVYTIGAKYETLGRTVSETHIVSFVNLCGFNEPLHGTGMAFLGGEIR